MGMRAALCDAHRYTAYPRCIRLRHAVHIRSTRYCTHLRLIVIATDNPYDYTICASTCRVTRVDSRFPNCHQYTHPLARLAHRTTFSTSEVNALFHASVWVERIFYAISCVALD